MPRRLIRATLFACAVVVCFARCSCSSSVTIVPPRVPQGGRALSIAVTPGNANRLFVTSETGGLFRTFDGGTSWQHLDGLPNYQTVDVAVAWTAPQTIIATARSRFHTANDGGIWRSTDGGGSWKQPVGSMPPPSRTCPARPSAYGISHMPLTRSFFVGTDCGIAVSNDNGATWTHFVLNPGATAPDSAPHRVRSLLVINRTSGVAAADSGLFLLHSSGVWIPAAIRPNPRRVPPVHSFAAPWFASDRIFFLAHGDTGQKLFASVDGGETWDPVSQPAHLENREAFVRISKSPDGNVDAFDVYMGDGQRVYRDKFSSKHFSRSASWTQVSTDHLDPSDVAFDASEFRTPILLASDGGVHRTTNAGASWKLTGGGFGGFTALQINEVTGQAVTGTKPHLDLYYSTQDNDIKASSDGGHSWGAGYGGGEGKHLRTAPTSVDHQGTRVTWWQSADSGQPHIYRAAPHFQSQHVWPSAPDGQERFAFDTPFLIVEDVYLQPTFDTTVTPTAFNYFLTQSAGASWRPVFTLLLKPQGPSSFAGSLANPTVYQGVFSPGFTPKGDHFGLMRVKSLATTAAVSRADSAGMRGLGLLHTPIARYVVFGADPRNANHLLAPDVVDKQMKFSADGGSIWSSHPALTQAVTDSGRFIFTIGDESLASVIAWDPYHPCTVLVGTAQNGVIQSRDGGRTWARTSGSEKVTHISSFFFPPTGDIWISSSGRGLWTLGIDRNTGDDAKRCPFPDPPPGGPPRDTLIVLDPATGTGHPFLGMQDPLVCPRCSVALVKNGWVTGIQLVGDTIRELAIAGGTLFQLDRSGKEVSLTVPNVYRDGDGRLGDRAFARGIASNRQVRALVLEGGVLRGVISSRDEVPFAPARTPLVYALAVANAGDASSVRSGERVRITGRGFLPSAGSAQPLRIHFDGEEVAPRVPVRADGTFSIDLPMARPRGPVVIWVEQRDGLRATRERTSIEVLGAS